MNILPTPPNQGPPLPRCFGIKWPWKKELATEHLKYWRLTLDQLARLQYWPGRWVVITSGFQMGSILSAEAWAKERAGYLSRGETPPEVKYI